MFVMGSIRRAAQAMPDRLAIGFNGRAISYGEFWRLIDGCREALAPLLPGSGLALIAVDSILEGWILIFALRSLGLDTAVIRGTEQASLFEGLDVACLLTLKSEAHRTFSAPSGARNLRLTDPSQQPLRTADPLPPLRLAARPGGGAVLTSGTTGRPKIVIGRDASADAVRDRQARYLELGDGFVQQGEGTVMNMLNFGLWTGAGQSRPIFTWSQGGAIVVQQSEDFHRSLLWPGVTHTVATPQALIQLMALPDGAFPFLPDMQLIVVAGAITPSLMRQIQRRLTGRILINLSSTETGGWARTVVRTQEDLFWYRLDPNRKVEVVDDADRPLPTGELGRVRVAQRPGRHRSYLGDPAANAEFFSAGWFYPGDLGVLDGKGRLALHGRTTDVIQINGDKHPAVPWELAIQDKLGCEGVCILSGRWQGEAEQLHVFLETRRPIAPAVLNEALQSTLFGFDGVSVHRVDALPRTPMGKVQRIALAQQLFDGGFRTAG